MIFLVHFLCNIFFIISFLIREKDILCCLLFTNPITFFYRNIQWVIPLKLLYWVLNRDIRLSSHSIVSNVVELILMEFTCHWNCTHGISCLWNLLAFLYTALTWYVWLYCLIQLFYFHLIQFLVKVNLFNYGHISSKIIG